MSYGKLIIRCELVVRTGMHIGGNSGFSAIGAVDSPVIRDPRTGYPIVPGSSLKGKLRTLLARSLSSYGEKLPEINKDDEKIQRLFGSADPVRASRLQFADAFVTNADEMKKVGLTEVKSENSINRTTSVANPRQIERVAAGTKFAVCIVYEVVNEEQIEEDIDTLITGMRLLQMDYLGGHGSRGSGRVSLREFKLKAFGSDLDEDYLELLGEKFREVESYELLPV